MVEDVVACIVEDKNSYTVINKVVFKNCIVLRAVFYVKTVKRIVQYIILVDRAVKGAIDVYTSSSLIISVSCNAVVKDCFFRGGTDVHAIESV